MKISPDILYLSPMQKPQKSPNFPDGPRLITRLLLFFAVFALPFVYRLEALYAEPGLSTPIRVVATLPVLKDLAEVVGGAHVRVDSLITGFESEHSYQPKPSDLILVQKAKLLLKIGLGLEIWVEPLIENAAQAELLIVTTSAGVTLIAHQGADADRHFDIRADAHAGHHGEAGNPHIWLDPENVKIMVKHIQDALIQIDATHENDYRRNTRRYIEQLSALEKELQEKVAALKSREIITHHPAWPYFAQRFGFVIKGNILRQIGNGASAKRISDLIRLLRKEKIRVIVSEPQLNQKIPQILAEESGAKIISLSPLPGAIPGTTNYLALIRYNVETLVSALEK